MTGSRGEVETRKASHWAQAVGVATTNRRTNKEDKWVKQEKGNRYPPTSKGKSTAPINQITMQSLGTLPRDKLPKLTQEKKTMRKKSNKNPYW